MNFSISLRRLPYRIPKSFIECNITTNEFLYFLYTTHYSQELTIKYRFYIFKNINFINFYSLSLNLFYCFQYWPNQITCQVIWPKRTLLHFCTLPIRITFKAFPIFFCVVYLVYFKDFFTILSQRIYRRRKKIFRLRWPNYPKLPYFNSLMKATHPIQIHRAVLQTLRFKKKVI